MLRGSSNSFSIESSRGPASQPLHGSETQALGGRELNAAADLPRLSSKHSCRSILLTALRAEYAWQTQPAHDQGMARGSRWTPPCSCCPASSKAQPDMF